MEFDFSTNTEVADINKIPQDFRGLYKQNGDKFVLDTENAAIKSAVSAITGLNTALRASRLEAKNKPQPIDLTPLKEYGEDPNAISEGVKARLQQLQDQIKGVNVDKIKGDLEGEWKGRVSKAEDKAVKAEQSFHRRVVVGEAKAAIADCGGDVELLLPFVLQNAKIVTKADGELDVIVCDTAGDMRYSGVTQKPMTIKERVAEMKGDARFGKLFNSEAPAGGGTVPGSTTPPAPKPGTPPAQGAGAVTTPIGKIAAGLRKGQFQKAARS